MSTQQPPAESCQAVKQILAAAQRLFALNGFDGVSVNAVANEAGVSKANVFHHFGTKEDLYLEVLRHGREELSRELERLTADTASDLAVTTRSIAHSYLRHIMENEDLARLFLRESLEQRPGRAKSLADKVFGQNFRRMASLFRQAQVDGRIRPDIDPALPVILIVAASAFFLHAHEVLGHIPEAATIVARPEEFEQALADLLLNGMADPDNKGA